MPLIDNITKPTLLIDEAKCRRNIRFMAEKAKKHGLIFRPHFKTHQNEEIALWFREEGVKRICVSSGSMAGKFASASWHHILIAFPFNIRETEQIQGLANHCNLSVLIESVETAEFLMQNLEYSCNFYIKIDTGYHRTGVDAGNIHYIRNILDTTQGHPKLKFEGFLVHAGNTYGAKSTDEIAAIHFDSIEKLKKLKEVFIGEYPELIISTGDTPSCSIMEDFRGIDEIRPGNFVFYDVMQAELGACSYDDLAVAVACPVVAKHRERNEMVIQGGAVHLSKEFITREDGQPNYGLLAEFEGNKWSNPLENTYLSKLSQEHGIIKTTDAIFNRIKIGQLLAVLPIHSCLTVDAMRAKYLVV